VSRVHGLWTTETPVHHGPAAIAALGSSPELGLRPLRCPRALTEGRAGELNGGVATAREAVEGRLTGDGNLGSEGRRRGRGEGVGGVGCFTRGGVGFYRAKARPSVFNGRR
jgi:hypothetical protein